MKLSQGRGVFFGEALFRFSARRGDRLQTATSLDFHLGGTELNIAANLVSLGHPCGWVSVLPEGDSGDLIMARAQALGVSLKIVRAKGEPGWYLLEPGAAPRGDRVFSRSASVLARQEKVDIDWSAMAIGVPYFHTSGVTAGLSESASREVERAMNAMKTAGALISYDFNYRKNLWSPEESVARQLPLLEMIDVLFCSGRDLELHFGERDPKLVFGKSNIQTLVMSKRAANEATYAIDVFTREGKASSRELPVTMLDRIGMGDSMAAGFWAAQHEKFDLQKTADFAAACGAMKATIDGDMALLKKGEVLELLEEGYQAVRR
ncbi:MAG: sugar kinase [Bdellovibrionota bacterium]